MIAVADYWAPVIAVPFVIGIAAIGVGIGLWIVRWTER